MSITKQTEAFEALLRRLPEGQWELYDGDLHEKPPMTAEHTSAAIELSVQLSRQLKRDEYRIRVNAGGLLHAKSFYIPDVTVLPAATERAQRRGPDRFEIYDEPVPLVVEVWSPSTGAYEIDAKLPASQQRRDQEIWRVHPFERSVTGWRLQPDGNCSETWNESGSLRPNTFPDIGVNLSGLWT